MQEVADPEQDLRDVERLGEEVARTVGQGPLLGLPGHVGREDEDREELFLGDVLAQLLQDGEPVEARHVEVQQDEVGLIRLEQLDGDLGVARGHEAFVPPLPDAADEQIDVRLLVVHDQDPGAVDLATGHGSHPRWRAGAGRWS